MTVVQKERLDCGTSWKFAGTTLFRDRRTVSYDKGVDYLQLNLWGAWSEHLVLRLLQTHQVRTSAWKICIKALSLHSLGGTLPHC